MSIRIRSLAFVLLMIMLYSSVVSGQDEPKILLIGGIWQTAEDQAKNQEYASSLDDAKYIPTYYSSTKNPYAALDETTITGKVLADVTKNEALAADAAAKAEDLLAVRDATPEEKFYTKDPDTGVLIMKDVKPKATDLNGLTSELLQHGKNYDTIYSHSGGTRTAVSALLYQGVTAEKLVLISPTTGGLTPKHQELFKWELQQLLDLGIVKEIVVYQAKEDTPPVGSFWQAKFELGDIKGNFKIEDLSGQLEGKTGDAAHKQMWETALSKDNQAIKDLLLEEKSDKLKPKSILRKEFMAPWQTPLISPTSGASGFCSAQNVPETTGVSYFDQANDVWYIDAFSWSGDRSQYDRPAAPRRFVSGELNPVGYNWVSLPYSRTGLWYDQGYFDWCAETLASMGQSAPSAGYGLLVGEDSEF